MSTILDIATALHARRSGTGWMASCPAHKDTNPSLSIHEKDGQVLLFCHSGCPQEAVLAALRSRGLWPEHSEDDRTRHSRNGTGPRKVAKIYDYTDEHGVLLKQKVRYDPKDFIQRRPDDHGGWIYNVRGVPDVLYNLRAVLSGSIVYVAEGEKDCDALNALGLVATCNSGGAGKWHTEHNEPLRGKEVVVIPDNDEPGRKHAKRVVQSVRGIANRVYQLELPGAKDAAEWISHGGTLEQLIELTEQARQASGNGHSAFASPWPDEPTPLGTELPPVPSFSTSLLPEVLRAPADDIANRMQVPLDYPGVCLVVSLAGAVNRRARIQPKQYDSTWLVVPNLWGALIAPPGFLKTPVLKAAAEPLYRIERLWREQYHSDLEEYETEKETLDLRLSAWKDLSKAAHKNKKTPPLRPDTSLAAPTQKRLIIGDATFEKQHELMAQNPAGLITIRDELSGWMAQLDRPGREGERAFNLECWNGDTGHSIDRIGRGSIYVPACCLSILGNFTPGRLRSYLIDTMKDSPGNDGLMQRFQVAVWPDAPAKWTYVDQLPVSNRVYEMLTRLTSLDADAPLHYVFDPSAQGLFIEWLTDLENRIRSNTMHPALISHLSKLRKTMPSICLLYALADDYDSPIGVGHTRAAIDYVTYLEGHARRIYSCVVSARMQAAADLAGKIRSGVIGKDGTFARRDVYRNHWTGLDTPDNVSDALEILRDAGWVRPREKQPTFGRPPDTWEVHPSFRKGPKF